MNAVVRARIDEKVKKQAEEVLASVGLTTSAAFRLLMHKVVSEKRLPFDPLIPNVETIKAMQEARTLGGPGVDTAAALWAKLDAKDNRHDQGIRKRSKARVKRPTRKTA